MNEDYLPHQRKTEKQKAIELLQSFDYRTSRAFTFITQMCGESPSKNSLVALGQIFSVLIGVKFERGYGRRKELIIKWFDMNLDQCLAWANNVKVIYKEQQYSNDND